jgi:methylation protein EvaC
MSTCLVCDHATEPFLSFGRMPIANGFLTRDEFAGEPFFDLAIGFCERCKMVQLIEPVDPRKMFHEHYPFFSSTSSRMASHFQSLAGHIKARHLGADPFVVEIGSNDGIFLRHFASAGIRHLGIEPSAGVAAAARAGGVNTIGEFFSEAVARNIVAEHGHADAVVGANVMCHIPAIHGVAAGIAALLKPSGVLIFEDPYLGDIIAGTAYDQIYDEHVFYFSVTALDYLFARHGLEIVDVEPQTTHGGSMRYTVGRAGAHQVSGAAAKQRQKEQALGLGQAATYDTFRKRVELSRDDLMALLRRLRAEGKRVVGYGATSKSTTAINYCGISHDLVEFISDTTPIKQGKFSPGAHIPIKPPSEFRAAYPDYALLFAWNHAAEIKANETAFAQSGGRWLRYVPQVAIEG